MPLISTPSATSPASSIMRGPVGPMKILTAGGTRASPWPRSRVEIPHPDQLALVSHAVLQREEPAQDSDIFAHLGEGLRRSIPCFQASGSQ